MNKFVILLVCMASLVTAGVVASSNMLRLDLQGRNLQGIGTHQISRMSRDDLLRQKFLLDVLQHVQQPLVNVELLELGQTLIIDQNMYIQGIDDEMLHIIELGRNQRLLSNQEVFTITNEDHMRQMIGIYRILVRSRDWDTFQRNACYLRMHVNGVLLVNSLLLVIRDRQDTQDLIIPGIHEILPELYQDVDIIKRVQNIDLNSLTTNTETMRPGLLDMIGMNRRVGLLNRNVVGTNMNRVGVLNRSQLWMPWREMRLEMAMRKAEGENTHVMMRNEDKIVLPVEHRLLGDRRISLLTQDVGLKSLLHGLINDLCLKEDELINGQMMNQENLGRVGLEQNVGSILERERLLNIGDASRVPMGISGVRTEGIDNEQIMQDQRRPLNIQDENILGGVVNRDSILDHQQIVMDVNDRLPGRQNRVMQGNQRLLARSDLGSSQNNQIDQLPTTDIDNDRLLHISRRRLQSDLNTMSQRQGITLQNQEDRLQNILHGGQVHDGRRVIDDEQLGLHMNRRDDIINLRSNINDEDILERLMNRNRVTGGEQDILDRENRLQERKNRIMQGNLAIKGRSDLDNSRINQINQLPSTDINSDRLLHINRRRIQQRGGVTLQNQQDRMMNILHGGQVLDGRHINRQESGLNMEDERVGLQMQRNQVIRDNMINSRRNEQDIDINDLRNERLIENRQRLLKNDDEQGPLGIRNQNIRGQQQQLDLNLPTTTVDDERLLHINRRRLDSNLDSRGQITRGMNDIDELQMRRQNMRETQRGMEDIGTDRLGRNQQSMNQQRMNIGQQGRLINDNLIDDMNMNMGMMQRRTPRSLHTDSLHNNRLQNIELIRGGELLIHNLQQLLARINMERISVGLIDLQDNIVSQHMNNPRLTDAVDVRHALRMNDMRLNTRRDRLMLDKINEIEQRMTMVINQEVRRIAGMRNVQVLDQIDIDRVIGDILMGKIQGVGILHILREILLETQDIHGMQSLTHLGVDLQDPILLHLLRRILRLTDLQRQQQLGSYKRNDLVLNGVTINDVIVDKLQTLVDVDDADLVNLIDSRIILTKDQGLHKMVVARQQRLNHKDFTIRIGLTSDRNQQVVVRTLLGPKIDAMGRQVKLDEQRHNFMLLDATVADLQVGQNLIKRRSQDIMWTARDTTPYTEIYQRVLMAINGNLDMTLDRVQGQVCGLPHRLLLPRGRIEGLPMQLLVIATPIQESDLIMQQTMLGNTLCGIGISSLNLDSLPLGFPLDRRIDDVQQLLNLPNLHLKDVLIHHEDKQIKNIL